jgi:hypothetical protein
MSSVPYIVFEHLEEHRLKWSYSELQIFFFHWNDGFSLQYICNVLNREWGEGALLVISIAEQRSRVMLQRPRGIKVQSPLDLNTNYTSELTRFYKEVKEQGGVYTVFDYQGVKPKIDLVWNSSNLNEVISSWKAGRSIPEMSKKLKRKPLDVALLIIDLVSQGFLEIRENGWEGDLNVVEAGSGKAEEDKGDRAECRSA